MSVMEIPTESPIRGLAAELQRQLASKRDLIADTRRVSFTQENPEWLRGESDTREADGSALTLLVDGADGGNPAAFGVTRHAHTQIADRLGVPWKFYERIQTKHPSLLVGLANGLLSREPEKRMLRTMDGKVRAFLSDRYRPRDNWDLLDKAILPELNQYRGTVEFKQATLTETRLYVKVVFPDIERPVTPKVGDVIRGGLIFQNSEVGDGSLGIYPYSDRLICLNGMVHTDFGKRSVHVGGRIQSSEEVWDLYSDATLQKDDDAFFAKCRDTVKAVLDASVFEAIVAQMQDLAGLRLSAPPDEVIEVFARRHSLTDGESGSMLSALIDEADRSAWGYLNALTRTARDTEDVDRQTELETLAGRLCGDPQSWATLAA